MERQMALQARPALACGFALACWIAAACGEASCPAGSISVNDRCEPALVCRPGETEDGGACVDDSPGLRGDAEVTDSGQHETPSDAAVGVIDSGADAFVESPNDSCDALACGLHGECRIVDGDATCVCSDGFDGEVCDECEPAFVLERGACIAPCDASGAPSCNGRGACENADGVAICACEAPYRGDACSECVDGFALKADGTCTPDCGDCGSDAYCDDETGACVQRCGDGILDLALGEQCDPGRDVDGCVACQLDGRYESCSNDDVGQVTLDGRCYSFGDGVGGVAPPLVIPGCLVDGGCVAIPGAPWEPYCTSPADPASGMCLLACETAVDCPPAFSCLRGVYCWKF